MSRTLRKELPAIKLCGEETRLQKRKKMINVDSDVRELLSTLTSNKKRRTTPKGWDLFMTSLKDTEAPADVHLGWKWSKAAEKGDWGALKNE